MRENGRAVQLGWLLRWRRGPSATWFIKRGLLGPGARCGADPRPLLGSRLQNPLEVWLLRIKGDTGWGYLWRKRIPTPRGSLKQPCGPDGCLGRPRSQCGGTGGPPLQGGNGPCSSSACLFIWGLYELRFHISVLVCQPLGHI